VAVHSEGIGAGTLGRRHIAFGGRLLRARKTRVAFESTWLFWSALLLGVLRYADYADISEKPGFGTGIKYVLFAALLATLAAIAFSSKNWRLGWNAPTILLAFTFFACAPLLIQLGHGATPDSYSSAFCSTLVYSMAAFYDLNGKVVNFGTLRRRLIVWLLLLGLMYIGELLLRTRFPSMFASSEDATNQFNSGVAYQVKSAVVLIGLYLTTLSRQRSLTVFQYAVLASFLVLRPTSTVVLCLAVCVPIVFLIRNAQYNAAECMCYLILLVLAIFPFLIYASDNVSNFVKDAEGFIKTDTLGGASNTETRLEILRLAFERWQSSSLLFGEMFTGGTTVLLGTWWLSFSKTGLIPIHSDYLITLVEGGLLGYGAFNLMLAWIIRSHFRWLRRQPRHGKHLSAQAAMVAVAIPVTMTLATFSSANPFLQCYGVLLVVWFVLFCSEICKFNTQSGLERETPRGGH
jgi:hypothetical protein